MEGDDGPDEGSQVDNQHLVVGFDVERVNEVAVSDVGEEVEDVLQLVDDLMVDGELSVHDLAKMFLRQNIGR